MVRSKELIPDIYSQSYDLSIFTGIIDLIYTSREVDLLRIKNAHTPYRCFKEDLSELASLLGLLDTESRRLLSSYRSMVKEKGVMEAAKAILCFVTDSLTTASTVDISTSETTSGKYPGHNYKQVTGYVDFEVLRTELFEELIDKLIPVNVFFSAKHSKEYDVLRYELSSDGTYYTVIGTGSTVVANVVIPSAYKGIPITHIASEAFTDNKNITSVEIGENVIWIGEGAFSGCSATSIIFKDSDDTWDILENAQSKLSTTTTVNQDSTGFINAIALTGVGEGYTYYNDRVWYKTGNTYFTIYFDEYTNEEVEKYGIELFMLVDDMIVLAGSYISPKDLPQLSIPGFTFQGWYRSRQYNGTEFSYSNKYDTAQQITGDLKLYSYFKEIETTSE